MAERAGGGTSALGRSGARVVPHDPIGDEDVCPLCDEPWPCAERRRQRQEKKWIAHYLRSALYEAQTERVDIDGVEAIRWQSPLRWYADMTYGEHGLVVRIHRWDGDKVSTDASVGFVEAYLP